MRSSGPWELIRMVFSVMLSIVRSFMGGIAAVVVSTTLLEDESGIVANEEEAEARGRSAHGGL